MNDLRQKNPFKIPEEYFDELEEQFCNSEDFISKINPFNSPLNYFEDLETSLLKALDLKSPTNKKVSKKLILQFISAAAIILLVSTIFLVRQKEITNKDQALNDFIENYYLEDFDSYKILSMMDESEIDLTLNQITKQ
ncbi:MAG: hypothetical protein CMC01_07065 [Flavobacteriaceae bacterium]|nr:hypothetical protein [Flavobacteriaceae bacterium]